MWTETIAIAIVLSGRCRLMAQVLHHNEHWKMWHSLENMTVRGRIIEGSVTDGADLTDPWRVKTTWACSKPACGQLCTIEQTADSSALTLFIQRDTERYWTCPEFLAVQVFWSHQLRNVSVCALWRHPIHIVSYSVSLGFLLRPFQSAQPLQGNGMLDIGVTAVLAL